jgi:DNA-binding XRE family transcriptional regulator
MVQDHETCEQADRRHRQQKIPDVLQPAARQRETAVVHAACNAIGIAHATVLRRPEPEAEEQGNRGGKGTPPSLERPSIEGLGCILTLCVLPIIIHGKDRAMAKRENDFDEFMKEVGEESAAAGETAALAAYGEHFRLALAVIQLRKKQRWTQQQLAKASGVQQSEISRIERGQGNPTYRTLQALAQAVQMTVTFVASKPAGGRGRRQSAAAF